MKEPEIPANETARLSKLRSYGVLDTAPEAAFDALTTLAAHIAGTPIALVSLVDADRQWFKSRYGLDAPETPRDVSFCGHVVASTEPLFVEDAREDERFCDNPLVIGGPRVVAYAGFPLTTPDGFVLGTLCTIDQSPKRLTAKQQELLSLLARQAVDQLELRRRTAMLEQRGNFFDMSLTLFCTADQSMHFVDLNPAWERTLGFSLNELRAKPFLEFVHPDDRADTLQLAQRLVGGATTINFENRYAHKKGGFVHLKWNAIVRDGVFYAAAVDMSVSKMQDELIRESETRFRSIVETAVDAVIIIDEKGRIEQVNPAVEKLFGYGPVELLAQNIKTLMPAPYRDEHDGYLANYRETGKKTIIGVGREVVGERKDGTTFPAELAVSEFTLNDEKFFTGVVRDISDRKRIERMQSEFVSTVSHELRTPLTSIRGSLGLVAAGITGELPKEAKEYIDIALSNSDRLIRLINDILDIEKMNSGNMEFRFTTVELLSPLQEAIAANAAFADTHKVTLNLAPETPAVEVLIDVDRLTQVLTNLISNAVKFSPEGKRVNVSATLVSDMVRVSVRDFGPGIPEEFRDRIFGRFSQADASSTRQKGGTGLGLAISKSLVERMGGRINFMDADGGGTIFFFDLPYFSAVQPDAGDAGTDKTVLVCEDDPDVAAVLKKILSSAGYAVHTSPTVERTRRLLANHPYAAITLDLQLADGDAGELIPELRASELHRETPIIVVSGTNGKLSAKALRVADVIVKPFDDERLIDAVQNAILDCQQQQPRLLHVEDNPDIRRILSRSLPETWVVTGVDTLEAGRAALAKAAFDIVVLDLELPDGGGEDLLNLVGQAKVIVFSASEAPIELSRRVSAAMVKSRVDPMQVRDEILHVLPNYLSTRKNS